MGVKGLWRLIQSCGTPVPLESLENKILAVDVSIWLHQAVRGFKGYGNGSIANAHLLTLFHRICKLLFYRIRPVFVFDGGVPQLKRQTLATRRLRREAAAGKAQKVRDRLLTNLLRSQAVRKALGKKGPGPSLHHISKPVKKEKDLFELPPLTSPLNEKGVTRVKTESDSENEEDFICRNLKHENLHNFEYESNDFQSLPLEAQHEILSELQDTRKENSWNTINEMPQESNNFSSFQMERLLKRYNFQKKLDDVRSEIRKVNASEMEAQLFGDLEKHVSFTHKIASEDNSHSILVKNIKEDSAVNNVKNEVKKDNASNSKSSAKLDFLTELSKHGILSKDLSQGTKRSFDSSFSDSSNEDSLSNFSDEETNLTPKKKKKFEEAAFLKALDYVLDDSQLTQEEIYSLIQQTQKEVETESLTCKNEGDVKIDLNNPSTSANAPGTIYNSDDDSSSTDDDFIDVTDAETPESNDSNVKHSEESKNTPDDLTENEIDSNVDKVLGVKTDSLYIKILQQKLGDIVQHTPVKKTIDTRKPTRECVLSNIKESPNKDKENSFKSRVSPQKKVSVVLDFNKQILPDKDDIFKDIFKGPNLKRFESNMHDPSKQNNFRKNDEQIECNEVKKSEKHFSKSSDKNDTEVKNKTPENIKAGVNTDINNENNDNFSDIHFKYKSISMEKSYVDSFVGNKHETEKFHSDKNKDDPTLVTEIHNDSTSSVKDTSSDVELGSPLPSSNGNALDKSKILTDENLSMIGECSESNGETQSAVNRDIKNYSETQSAIHREIHLNEESREKVDDSKVIPKFSEDELKEMENDLAKEQSNLIVKVNDAERIAAEISDQVYGEAQELLRIFGLPYIVAPMEAEAQCAFLDEVGLTHGTITNDSDVFLFGGKRVYKNFFDQGKYVEFFKIENIKYNIGIDRNKMVTLALLTGSDYTVGIESVGSVLGMEILAEFPGKGIDCLKNLKKWWNIANKNISISQPSKAKQRLCQLYIPDSFPNENIYNAYLNPEIDDSKEKFTWGIPNIENVRSFTSEKFGWNHLKTNEIMIPVLKKLGLKETQMRIESYFNNIKLVKEPHLRSKRLEEAIAKSKDENEINCDKEIKGDKAIQKEPKNPKRTLLVDPSQGTYGAPSKKKRGRKKLGLKKENDASNLCESSPSHDLNSELLQSKSKESESVPLSKEEKKLLIYKKLQEKEKILQSEKEKQEKEKRKHIAAQVLSKSKSLKKRK